MKNLFILGSPRKNGNSETMARAVARGILQTPENSVEYVRLNSLDIRPCQGCGGCNKTGECVIKDDMQELYTKTNAADRLFLVSPIYFYSVSAQLKCYIDRCQAQWARKYLVKDSVHQTSTATGHLLSCAATNGDKLFDGAINIIQCLCDTLDIHYGAPLLIRNLEPKNALQNNSEKLTECIRFGTELAAGKQLP